MKNLELTHIATLTDYNHQQKECIGIATYRNMYTDRGNDTQIQVSYSTELTKSLFGNLYTDIAQEKITGDRTLIFENYYTHIDFCASQNIDFNPKTFNYVFACLGAASEHKTFINSVKNGYTDVKTPSDYISPRNETETYVKWLSSDYPLVSSFEMENENDSHTRYVMGVMEKETDGHENLTIFCGIIALRNVKGVTYCLSLPVYGFQIDKNDKFFSPENFLPYHDEIFVYAKSACDIFFNSLTPLRTN